MERARARARRSRRRDGCASTCRDSRARVSALGRHVRRLARGETGDRRVRGVGRASHSRVRVDVDERERGIGGGRSAETVLVGFERRRRRETRREVGRVLRTKRPRSRENRFRGRDDWDGFGEGDGGVARSRAGRRDDETHGALAGGRVGARRDARTRNVRVF